MLLAAIALVAWLLGGTDLLLAVVLATVVLGIALVGYMVAQAERRLRSAALAEIQRASASSLSAVAESTEELRRSMAQIEEELDRKLQRPAEQAEALLRAIRAGYKRMELEQRAGYRRLDEAQAQRYGHQSVLHNHGPAEIDALLQVHRRLKLEDPLPLMGGWALSPRGMLQAIDLAGQPHVSLVVECGSGTSTLFMARALQLQGHGERRLVALEHLPEFLELTRTSIKEHGLDHIAEVRFAPLEEVIVHDDPYMWYDVSAIKDLTGIDLLLVYGLPRSTGASDRYPAYPLFRERLAADAVILVDDIERQDERDMVDRWLEHGELTEHPALGRKQILLRMKTADG